MSIVWHGRYMDGREHPDITLAGNCFLKPSGGWSQALSAIPVAGLIGVLRASARRIPIRRKSGGVVQTKIRLSLKIARLERKVYQIEKWQAKLTKRDEKLKAKNAKEGSQPDNVEYQFSSDVDLQKNRMLFTWCNRAFIALALYIPFCEVFGFSLWNFRFCIIKCLYQIKQSTTSIGYDIT